MNLMALMLAMFAQLIILIFSLWLLFRTTVPSIEFAQPVNRSEMAQIRETAAAEWLLPTDRGIRLARRESRYRNHGRLALTF